MTVHIILLYINVFLSHTALKIFRLNVKQFQHRHKESSKYAKCIKIRSTENLIFCDPIIDTLMMDQTHAHTS